MNFISQYFISEYVIFVINRQSYQQSGTETTNTFCVFLCFTTPTCTESVSGQPSQKLQIVIIVSQENILHTSPSLLPFHSFT